MAFLKVISNGEERTVFLGDEPVVLGRGEDADVLLKDVKASRAHCVIEPTQGGWAVRDLGSGNGTRLNGERIAVRTLSPDDVVKVGDTRIVFAGAAAAVVRDDPSGKSRDGDASRPARAGRAEHAAPRGRARGGRPFVVAGIGVTALLACLAVWGALGGGGDPAEERAYASFREAKSDREIVLRGTDYLEDHLASRRADEVRAAVDAARERLDGAGASAGDGWDPAREIEGLERERAIAKLEGMVEEVPAARRGKVRVVLEELRAEEQAERDAFFARVEEDFRECLGQGEYARARQIWFFLAGEESWQPIPRRYERKIVAANSDLEAAAVAERAKLFDEASRYEAAYRFKEAIALLRRELPRFSGTSVERSLRDRIRTYELVLERGIDEEATRKPASLVRVDVGEKMEELLARLPAREFAAVASGLEELAAEAKRANDPGHAEIAARARECGALARLHAAVVEALSADVPNGQIRRRYRILGADAGGLTVRFKGEETRYTWNDVPVPLYLALLERHAGDVQGGWLGLVVAARALEGESGTVVALATAYGKSSRREALDAFVAGRLRKEPVPDGGYVVHEGSVLTRREFVRKREQELIARYKKQLAESLAAIEEDRAFRGLDKMKKRKAALDEARRHALALIFDEKRYFYPYRNTPREGEYWKVQAEVDQRVEALRELWNDPRTISVKSNGRLEKRLGEFDEAARELGERLVDVAAEVEHVGFLRAHLDRRFTIRDFFRDPEEMRALRYSQEVMEANPGVQGDIRPDERAQVRVTNEYRLMFGRRALRLVDQLVLSSRGHCEEMARIGYFGHFSPTKGRRTPGDRMRLAGYTYGASENCANGATTPEGAHNQWCHSSGHHRNLLMAPWTEMGTGRHGRLWTQNFGMAPTWSKDDASRSGDGAGAGDRSDGNGDPDGDAGGRGDDDGFDYGDG